jgi:hypothetical protein
MKSSGSTLPITALASARRPSRCCPTVVVRAFQTLRRVYKEALNGHRSPPLLDNLGQLLLAIGESLGHLSRIFFPFVALPPFFLLLFPLLLRGFFGHHKALQISF